MARSRHDFGCCCVGCDRWGLADVCACIRAFTCTCSRVGWRCERLRCCAGNPWGTVFTLSALACQTTPATNKAGVQCMAQRHCGNCCARLVAFVHHLRFEFGCVPTSCRCTACCFLFHGLHRKSYVDTILGVRQQLLNMTSLDAYLFRADASRQRETKIHHASGLGLAIVRSITSAHQGHVTARHSPLGGLAVQVTLPLQPVHTQGKPTAPPKVTQA